LTDIELLLINGCMTGKSLFTSKVTPLRFKSMLQAQLIGSTVHLMQQALTALCSYFALHGLAQAVHHGIRVLAARRSRSSCLVASTL